MSKYLSINQLKKLYELEVLKIAFDYNYDLYILTDESFDYNYDLHMSRDLFIIYLKMCYNIHMGNVQ
jgi:hypothetical protein